MEDRGSKVKLEAWAKGLRIEVKPAWARGSRCRVESRAIHIAYLVEREAHLEVMKTVLTESKASVQVKSEVARWWDREGLEGVQS